MGSPLRRITVDLTPVETGGSNGGAKVVSRALVRELSLLAPATEFLLLTSAASHAELADLDAPNVRRQCVDADLTPIQADSGALGGARFIARGVVDTLLPVGARARVKDATWRALKRSRRAAVARDSRSDLLLCPFTAPFYFDPRVPTVAVVHDLQFLDYPDFFDEERRASRSQHFQEACARADLLVCVSEFVRQSVLAHSERVTESVVTIHSTVLQSTATWPGSADVAERLLTALGLGGKRFLLYPANAWPHKNHRRLLEAFALFLREQPTSDMALVCTGAPGIEFNAISAHARALLPEGTFGFAGYVPEREFAALLHHCRAMIFPSLYEGFGLPLLEAMACDRPVLCSDVTSLPEVAGDAAVLFNPLDAKAIVDAIQRLETEPTLEAALIARGHQRVADFGTPRDMAARYLASFERLVASRAAASGRSAG